MPKVAGIDPGIKGAICIAEYRQLIIGPVHLTNSYEMPKMKDNPKRVDVIALYKILKSHQLAFVSVERITGGFSPRGEHQSPVAQFNFGMSYAAVLHTLELSGIPYSLTMPAVWKKQAGITKQNNGGVKPPKSMSKTVAQSLWPNAIKLLSRVDKCEAALIARHGVLINPPKTILK